MSRARESPYMAEGRALLEGRRARLSTVALGQWATLPPAASERSDHSSFGMTLPSVSAKSVSTREYRTRASTTDCHAASYPK